MGLEWGRDETEDVKRWQVIKRKEFADDDATFFFTEEHWGMDCGGVAQLRIHQPRYSHNKENDVWDLFLTPEVARAVAAGLIAIADSVDRQQAEFERDKK
jgi:hypothetical protein